MKTRLLTIVILLISYLLTSCQSDIKQETRHQSVPSSDDFIKYNQRVLAEEEKLINNYLSRHAIQALTGRGGLRYHFDKKGSGKQVKDKMTVNIAYEVRFLTGDLVYSSKESGPRKIVLGKTSVESGLYDVILMMRVGDRAKIVLPSHLAFGASGDGDKIPPRTTLVYDIELIDAN